MHLARGHRAGVPWWFDLTFLGVIVAVGIWITIWEKRK